MTTKLNVKRVAKRLGEPKTVHKELREFTNQVHLMEARRAELTRAYPNKWIAMYAGDIKGVAESLEDLLEQLDRKAIPRARVVIEHMDPGRRTLVL